MIIQQAIKHWSGNYLITTKPSEIIQWEDATGHILRMSGGNEYFNRTHGFPGSSCTDLCLTSLDSEDTIISKLLLELDGVGNWRLVKDLSLEELLRLKEKANSLRPVDLMVIRYWIDQRSL